jgi:hypothetical protein
VAVPSVEVKCNRAGVSVRDIPPRDHRAATVAVNASPAVIGPKMLTVNVVAGSFPLRITVLMLDPLALVALQRKTYMSGTSGVNVGLRMDVEESVAVDPFGLPDGRSIPMTWRYWGRRVELACGVRPGQAAESMTARSAILRGRHNEWCVPRRSRCCWPTVAMFAGER